MQIYVLHDLQGQFSGTQALIFALKSASDSIVLYSFGARFHNFGPRLEGVSTPYLVVRILLDLKCEIVLKEYDFSINLKILFIYPKNQSQVFADF